MRGIAMTHRITYRRHLTGAIAVAALMINAPTATAQLSESQQRIVAGIDEAVKALDNSPRHKKKPPQAKKQLIEFVVGNILFVLAHEMGHALISEMNMPVLGREEDAADSFAVVTALKLHTAGSERVLIEAAKGWVLSSKRDKKQGNKLAFYDEHGLDLQRSYNVVCFMVGSDPARFKTLAEETKLPEERQTSCVRDYKTTAWSWDEMLKPHIRAADKPKVTIKVEYQDDKKYAAQAKILRDMGLLDALAAHMADRYVWPNPISMVARSCDEPNATWNIGAKTLTLCYELASEFIELYDDYSRQLPKKFQAAR
jgi:Putative metallopeptidase